MFKNAKISALEMLREDVAAGSKETVADNSEVNPSSGTGETTAASNDVQITQSQPTATGDGTYTVNGKTINVKSTGTGPVPDLASILKSNPRDNLSRTILNNATKNMESAKTSESTQTGESTQNNQASGQPPYNQEFFKDPWEYMQKRKAAEEQSADTKTLTSDDIISIGAGPLNPELVNNPEAFAEKYGVKKPEEKEKTNDVPPQYEKLNLVVDGLDEPKEETPVNTNSLEYKINEKRIEKETIISSNNEYIATGLTKVNRLAYDVYSSTFKSESFGSTTSVPTVENEIVSNAINGSIELAQKLSKLLNTIGEIGNRFDRIDADLVAEADNLGSIFRMDLSPKEKIAPITGGVGATKDADKLMKELPVIEEVKEEDEDKKLKLTSSEELEDGKDKDKDKDPDKDKDKGSDDPDAGAEDKKKKKPKGPGTSNPDKDKNKDKDKDKDKDPDKDKDKDKDKDPDKDKDKDKDSDKDKDKDKDDDKEKDPKEENKEDDKKDKVVTDDDENKDNQGNQDN